VTELEVPRRARIADDRDRIEPREAADPGFEKLRANATIARLSKERAAGKDARDLRETEGRLETAGTEQIGRLFIAAHRQLELPQSDPRTPAPE
jgi:hypothetical protein